jgi:Tol biopolymer transport system component
MTSSSGTSKQSITAILLVGLALFFLEAPAHAAFPGKNGKIIFTADPSGSWQIYTINPDGTGMHQVTHLAPTSWELWGPQFSPDGKKIVFAYGEGNAGPDVYVINTDGTGLKRLTHNNGSGFARWLPDGSRIVFVTIAPLTGQGIIATMRPDGSDVVSLTSQFELGNYLPTYSPDGAAISFGSSIGGLVSAAWIMDAHGRHQKRLTAPPIEAAPNDFSPDGQLILFWSHNSSPLPTAIWQMNIDGAHKVPLTFPGPKHDLDPNYSPDGSKIVFASDRMSNNRSLDLFTMNADGTDIKRIATGLTVGGCPDENCVFPSWGPKP